MKIKALLCAILFSTTSLVAQDEPQKRQEIGLSFNNFNNFGAAYRIGNDLALWRVGLDFGRNISKRDILVDSVDNEDSRSFANLSLGWEKRYAVADKLYFRIGGDVFYQNSRLQQDEDQSFPTSRSRETDIRTSNYGLRLVLGAMYQISPNMHFGFEILPSYSWARSESETIFRTSTFRNTVNTESSNSGFNLNTSSVRLNFGFNF